MQRRRKFEPDDAAPIHAPDVKAAIWNLWCKQWLYANLNEEQRQYKRREQTSIFNAIMKQRYGHKYFVMAMLETGITWGDGLARNEVARRFAEWAAQQHQTHTDTEAALQHARGLSIEQERRRRERDDARRNYDYALGLEQQLAAGKGRAKSVGKGRKGAPEHVVPRTWQEMSYSDHCWLRELWNGNLGKRKTEAERRHGGRVQARPFMMS